MWIYSNFDSPFSPGHDWAGFVHNKNKYSFWECINCFMKNLFSIINPSGLEQIHTFVVISMSCTHTICLPAKLCECWGGINYSTMRSYREIHKKTCGDTVCNCSLLKQIKPDLRTDHAIWLSCQTQYANCHSQDAWRTAAFHSYATVKYISPYSWAGELNLKNWS